MRRGFIVTASGAALVWLSAGVAAAAPFGTLATAACTGQGVTVTATTIDWLPADGGTGCINTVMPTNVAYDAGVLGPGTAGLIKDLTPATPLPVSDFMTFAVAPSLHFDLTTLGPGVGNLACVNTYNPADQVCSIVAGSPFVLRPGSAGTTVTLAAFGVARDANGTSPWQGTFSVDFAGETPAALQARFLATGTITSGHSGSFVVTPVPEPASLLLLGTGLIGAAARARKGLRRREK